MDKAVFLIFTTPGLKAFDARTSGKQQRTGDEPVLC
jgi:hypothetical protein